MKIAKMLVIIFLFSCSKSINYDISFPVLKGFLPPLIKKHARFKIHTDSDKKTAEFYIPYENGELYFATDGTKFYKSYYYQKKEPFWQKDHIYTGKISSDYLQINLTKKDKHIIYSITFKKNYIFNKRREDCIFFQEFFTIPVKTKINLKVPVNYLDQN